MKKTLLIDADDTLWENNIYFEQVRAQYVNWMRTLGYDSEAVAGAFDEIERRNIQLNGYGAGNFVRSLKETYLRFHESSIQPEAALAHIDQMAEDVRRHPIQLLEGVRESLEVLSRRHDTILLTKGNTEEQERKIEASGLSGYFGRVEILREKDVESFRAVIARLELQKAHTWMVGNSPKSDINPAIAAGIQAFYIPHLRTWEMEKEELCISDRVVILERFSDLLKYV